MKAFKTWQIFILGLLSGLILSAALILVIQNSKKQAVEVISTTMTADQIDLQKGAVISDQTRLINLNTATLDELDSLPGIGKTKAEAILSYRVTNGPYKSIQDLLYVPGIGESVFDQMKEFITVK